MPRFAREVELLAGPGHLGIPVYHRPHPTTRGERKHVSDATANDLEVYLWNEQLGWSQTADRLRDVRTRSRSIVMALTVAGAVLQTFAGTGDPAFRTAAGIAGTIALSLAVGIAGFFLKPENTQRWLRARSVAEGIKSEFYAYRASADPYTAPDALQLLQEKIRGIIGYARDLAGHRARTIPKMKPMPEKLDAEQYLRRRIDAQIESFYLPKAKLNADRAARFRNVEIGLALLAAIMSAISTYVAKQTTGVDASSFALGPWIAVITTLGGSIAAYAAASRYEFQATSYYATAQELRDLKHSWILLRDKPEANWAAFVRRCEEVISAENQAWKAKLLQDSAAAEEAPVAGKPA